MQKKVFFCLLIIISPAVSKEYFVSPKGSDSNSGSKDQPFATLGKARDAFRNLKKTTGVPPGGVTIWIREGTYFLSSPISFTKADSGTRGSPVVYRAERGKEVRITGGKKVKGFVPVTDPEILKKLDPAVRGKVLQADLKFLGIKDFGSVATIGKRLELFFNDKPMQLSRWPNKGFIRIKDVAGKTLFKTHGISGTREGELVYPGERPSRWLNEDSIYLHGYWFWDWSDSFEKVRSIDTKKHIISTAPPYHHYGFRKGQRFYAINLLCELDAPGEWYLDRGKKILYFLPPAPMKNSKVVLSVSNNLFLFKDSSWITLKGLILEDTRSTVVAVSGGANCKVSDCTIRNTGNWAVTISGGKKHSVTGCHIFQTGAGGISLNGGDRKTLTGAGLRAENNHIHNFGRLYRTYRPAVSVGGVGNIVRHNLIHNGPHNAIQLGGNDHIIEFNEIFNVCFETGDVGAFYMGRDWTARGTIIRYNYFHHIQGPGLYGAMAVYLDDAASGIKIIGNVFYKAGRAAFIGGGRDNLVENNIFVDCASSIHVDARGVGWMKNSVEKGGVLPQRLNAMPYKNSLWSKRYPLLVNILNDNPGEPKGNIVRRNISFGGTWLNVEKKAMKLIRFEDNLVDKDPHFVNLKAHDFRLKPDSPAFKLGFKKIPIEKIGLLRNPSDRYK